MVKQDPSSGFLKPGRQRPVLVVMRGINVSALQRPYDCRVPAHGNVERCAADQIPSCNTRALGEQQPYGSFMAALHCLM